MRQLRIVGVDADSSVVECEVRDSGEKLSLPLDDRLKAAARGEFVPSGSASRPPVTGTLRPREIQDRIRHGASPEEVASEAGVPLSRIEGFAVPVLLERATAADLARNAHPVLPDGPALDTLADRLESALDRRGIDPDLVRWDAWRDRTGGWVVRTSWPAGLSDDASATWSFVPDSHGGAAHALDVEAEAVLDPDRAVGLRTVPDAPPLPPGPPPIRAVPAAPRLSAPETATEAAPQSAPGSADAAPAGSATDTTTSTAPERPGAGLERSPATVSVTPVPAAPQPTSGPAPQPATGRDGEDDDEDGFLQHPPAEPERRTSRRHPTMPSWEDVLLGVRGKDD